MNHRDHLIIYLHSAVQLHTGITTPLLLLLSLPSPYCVPNCTIIDKILTFLPVIKVAGRNEQDLGLLSIDQEKGFDGKGERWTWLPFTSKQTD